MRNHIRPLFGLEFEVSLSALDARMRRVSPARVLARFMSIAGERCAHLPGQNSTGIFLGNGGRLYLDCGKPEITTPEVVTPTDACRYSRAGERILLEVCDALMSEIPDVEHVILTRGNVSYGGSTNAWACHESYSHCCDHDMADDFVPHAVSRIIYTGAGGFDNRFLGTRFLVSPRVACLQLTASENTQSNRAIFNTKDEPLSSAQFHRLHVICGENESSILSQWLKMATTAVVVAMTQAGLSPGADLQLLNPVFAMRRFARDVTLTANALTTAGRRVTALDMQRQLLEKAKRLDVPGPINAWLPDCLHLWETTLDRLQQGPAAVQRSIDWAIKLELFQNYVARRGLTWERLEQWNDLFERLARHSHAQTDERRFGNDTLRIPPLATLREARRELDPQSKLDWDELDVVVALRQELFEIDTRFGELGKRGIFNSLDRQGLLDHQVSGVEDIRQAMVDPPNSGRARLRGRVIKQLARQGKLGACEWNAVWDFAGPRLLDLDDPFASEEKWTMLPGNREEQVEGAQVEGATGGRPAMVVATALYDRGEYETAHRMMLVAHRGASRESDDAAQECGRFLAWIQARRGYTDGALWLERSYGHRPTSLAEIVDCLEVYRFQGLRPGLQFHLLCTQGLRKLASSQDADPAVTVKLRCAHAYDLLCHGRLDESWAAYHDGIRRDWMRTLQLRLIARILTERADLLRRLGRLDESIALLNVTRQLQIESRCTGDIADLTLTQRAKVTVQKGLFSNAWEMLQTALQTQRDTANVVGEVRTLLLMERIRARAGHVDTEPDEDAARARFMMLCETRRALTDCALATTIRDRWWQWCAGYMLPGQPDPFWGL